MYQKPMPWGGVRNSCSGFNFYVFLLGTENAMGVGITDIPDSRTRGPSGVGLGAGKKM